MFAREAWWRKSYFTGHTSRRSRADEGQAPNPFFEKLVFAKLRAKLGGNVRYMSTGSAPISAEVMEFLRICFGTVLEGYGMTESACVISKTSEDDFTTGHVGSRPVLRDQTRRRSGDAIHAS